MKHVNWVKLSCATLAVALVLPLSGCGKLPTEPDPTLRLEATAATEVTETTAATEPTAETEAMPEETLAKDPNHNHEYKETKIVKPTCTTEGYTVMTCSCGESYMSDKTAAIGHKYTDKVVAPTTSERGYTLHTCKNCGSSYKDNYTNKLPSKPSKPAEPKPTEPQKPTHKHSYTETVVEATCESDGYTEYTCTVCSHSYKDNIVKGGHKYKDTVVKPTCREQGYTEHKCEKCGDTKKDNYTDKIPHNFIPFYTAETCSQSGGRGTRCEWCGFIDEFMPIPPTRKHKYELVEEKEPTCVDYGYTKHVCSECGDEQIRQTGYPTMQHDYRTTIIDPTCTLYGYEKHECSVCGDFYNVERPDLKPLDHDYKKTWTSATCTQPGFATFTCNRCSNSVQEYEDALGHRYTHEEIIENVLCIVCNECGHNLGPKEVAAEPPKKDEIPNE